MMVSATFSGVSSAGTMTGCSTEGTCSNTTTTREGQEAVQRRPSTRQQSGERQALGWTLSEKLSATTEEMSDVLPVRAAQHTAAEGDERRLFAGRARNMCGARARASLTIAHHDDGDSLPRHVVVPPLTDDTLTRAARSCRSPSSRVRSALQREHYSATVPFSCVRRRCDDEECSSSSSSARVRPGGLEGGAHQRPWSVSAADCREVVGAAQSRAISPSHAPPILAIITLLTSHMCFLTTPRLAMVMPPASCSCTAEPPSRALRLTAMTRDDAALPTSPHRSKRH